METKNVPMVSVTLQEFVEFDSAFAQYEQASKDTKISILMHIGMKRNFKSILEKYHKVIDEINDKYSSLRTEKSILLAATKTIDGKQIVIKDGENFVYEPANMVELSKFIKELNSKKQEDIKEALKESELLTPYEIESKYKPTDELMLDACTKFIKWT